MPRTVTRPFETRLRRMAACALVLLVASLLMRGGVAWAAPPDKAVTLAGALRTAPTAPEIVLTVGAEKVGLADGQAAPPDGAGLADIAAAFGRQTRDFGAVTALAPLTTVALNPNPAPPDVTADLNPMTCFEMLAASLSDAQWQTLTSERGLGLPDLTDETQQKLFHALFRSGHLHVASEDPALAALPDDQRTDVQDVSDQIASVRLRLGQSADIYLHDQAGKTIFFGAGVPDAAQRLHTWSPKRQPPPALHAVALRATVPNVPKDGDLDFDNAPLQAPIPLAGLRTVDDLIARVAQQTHLEVYADPHYGHRTVTILGTNATAPAADLLRALALCLCGTYRQVGPAYVLTDDLVGVGTRRQRLSDWETASFAGTMSLGDQAGQELLARHGADARTLPTFADPLALSPEQMAGMKGEPGLPEIPEMIFDRPGVPFAKLSPAQQTLARHIAEAYRDLRDKNDLPAYLDQPQDPDLNGSVDLQPQTKVQFLIPSLDKPVDTNLDEQMSLFFWPGAAAMKERQRAVKTPPAPKPPAPPLAPLLRSRPLRAVFGHPRTARDVDALVAVLRRVGLNALFLDVFSGGESHLTGTPDILTEALARTRGTGIAVYADLSLLSWGDAPPEDASDLTIQGRTSREAATDAHDRQPEPDYDDSGQPLAFVPPPVAVSPVAAKVRDVLVPLLGALTDRPGLAGFVWEDAGPDYSLGYTPAMRLAFLRAQHADPLDVTVNTYNQGDVSLPGFDDPAVDKAQPDLWAKAKTDAALGLLRQMREAVPPTLPILMEQGAVRTNWLASWDDPRRLPPPLRPLFTDWPYPAPERIAATARTQGRVALLRASVPDAADAGALARALDADLKPGKQAAPPGTLWDGFVLDFADAGATRGGRPLAVLLSAAPPPAPAPR